MNTLPLSMTLFSIGWSLSTLMSLAAQVCYLTIVTFSFVFNDCSVRHNNAGTGYCICNARLPSKKKPRILTSLLFLCVTFERQPVKTDEKKDTSLFFGGMERELRSRGYQKCTADLQRPATAARGHRHGRGTVNRCGCVGIKLANASTCSFFLTIETV